MAEEQRSKHLHFATGWMQVKIGDAPSLKKELIGALGLTSPRLWHRRLLGSKDIRGLSPAEISVCEKLFNKYGVTDNIFSYKKLKRVNTDSFL